MRLSVRKLATWPSAWAPASVRPAPYTVRSSPVTDRKARFSSPSTLRAFFCCCQPANPEPSYSSTTLIFTCEANVDESVDEFDDHHGRRVADARALVDDPRVPARPLGQARDEVGEQPLHHFGLGHLFAHAPARVHVLVLGRRDEPLDPAAQLFGARLGRRDAAALEKRCAESAHQRLSGVGVAVEAAAALLVTQ